MLKVNRRRSRGHKKEEGMAVIEAIPVLFMLVMIFNFSLGFFGAIHSGILNSIGSYNYAFETFRYRSNLMYFRPGVDNKHYKSAMARVHGVTQDGADSSAGEDRGKWPATLRSITFNFKKGDATKNLGGLVDDVGMRGYGDRTTSTNIWHITSLFTPEQGQPPAQTPRIWIKTVYGICVNAVCGEGTDPTLNDRTGE